MTTATTDPIIITAKLFFTLVFVVVSTSFLYLRLDDLRAASGNPVINLMIVIVFITAISLIIRPPHLLSALAKRTGLAVIVLYQLKEMLDEPKLPPRSRSAISHQHRVCLFTDAYSGLGFVAALTLHQQHHCATIVVTAPSAETCTELVLSLQTAPILLSLRSSTSPVTDISHTHSTDVDQSHLLHCLPLNTTSSTASLDFGRFKSFASAFRKQFSISVRQADSTSSNLNSDLMVLPLTAGGDTTYLTRFALIYYLLREPETTLSACIVDEKLKTCSSGSNDDSVTPQPTPHYTVRVAFLGELSRLMDVSPLTAGQFGQQHTYCREPISTDHTRLRKNMPADLLQMLWLPQQPFGITDRRIESVVVDSGSVDISTLNYFTNMPRPELTHGLVASLVSPLLRSPTQAASHILRAITVSMPTSKPLSTSTVNGISADAGLSIVPIYIDSTGRKYTLIQMLSGLRAAHRLIPREGDLIDLAELLWQTNFKRLEETQGEIS